MKILSNAGSNLAVVLGHFDFLLAKILYTEYNPNFWYDCNFLYLSSKFYVWLSFIL